MTPDDRWQIREQWAAIALGMTNNLLIGAIAALTLTGGVDLTDPAATAFVGTIMTGLLSAQGVVLYRFFKKRPDPDADRRENFQPNIDEDAQS